jgi:AraC-like DNA-binding protein
LARVSPEQFAALIRVMIRVLRDEFWGLCNHPVRIGTFAHACRVMVEHKTLGEALRAGLRYYHLMIDDFVPRLQVQGNVASIELFERRPWDERLGYAESSFLYCGAGVVSWLAARKLPLKQVRLRNVKSGYNKETRWLFEADVLYAQQRAGVSFDARWLDLPVIQNTWTLASFLAEAPASLSMKYRDQTSAAERTRRLLRRHMGTRMLTLEEVSGMFGMTPQTLRRRLHEEGKGFQTIKDDLRRDMAIEYLVRPELTLQEISELVGFSETSTFHRAFKSWTSVAPGEYRLRRLNEEHVGASTAS